MGLWDGNVTKKREFLQTQGSHWGVGALNVFCVYRSGLTPNLGQTVKTGRFLLMVHSMTRDHGMIIQN